MTELLGIEGLSLVSYSHQIMFENFIVLRKFGFNLSTGVPMDSIDFASKAAGYHFRQEGLNIESHKIRNTKSIKASFACNAELVHE